MRRCQSNREVEYVFKECTSAHAARHSMGDRGRPRDRAACSRHTKSNTTRSAPRIDHILVEVSDLKRAEAFYRELIGLTVKSERGDFVTLEGANIGVFLRSKQWEWEKSRAAGERQGLGMHPHFVAGDVKGVVERARTAGYTIR